MYFYLMIVYTITESQYHSFWRRAQILVPKILTLLLLDVIIAWYKTQNFTIVNIILMFG